MKRGIKIIRNALQCKVCGEVIESKYVHDFVPCKCFRESGGSKGIFVDGGTQYLRWGGDSNTWIDLSESRAFTDAEKDEYNMKKIKIYNEYGIGDLDLME